MNYNFLSLLKRLSLKQIKQDFLEGESSTLTVLAWIFKVNQNNCFKKVFLEFLSALFLLFLFSLEILAKKMPKNHLNTTGVISY